MPDFKYKLGDIVRHRSQKYGDKFLILGRYAYEEMGDERHQNVYRVRSQNSYCLDMIEEEIIIVDEAISENLTANLNDAI